MFESRVVELVQLVALQVQMLEHSQMGQSARQNVKVVLLENEPLQTLRHVLQGPLRYVG